MVTAQPLHQPDGHPDPEAITVTVRYLPAAEPFHHSYLDETVVEVVRTQAMAFFQVSDRQERDKYVYYLVIGSTRLTNMNETLEQVARQHHHEGELHFHLVEEITPGFEVARGRSVS